MVMGGLRYILPTVIKSRYGPDHPQAAMLSDSATAIAVVVDIDMPTEWPIQEVRSPSHLIALKLGSLSASAKGLSNSS